VLLEIAVVTVKDQVLEPVVAVVEGLVALVHLPSFRREGRAGQGYRTIFLARMSRMQLVGAGEISA
jgi:hypothetical protein